MVKGNADRRRELARMRCEHKAAEIERKAAGPEHATPAEARARLLSDAKAAALSAGASLPSHGMTFTPSYEPSVGAASAGASPLPLGSRGGGPILGRSNIEEDLMGWVLVQPSPTELSSDDAPPTRRRRGKGSGSDDNDGEEDQEEGEEREEVGSSDGGDSEEEGELQRRSTNKRGGKGKKKKELDEDDGEERGGGNARRRGSRKKDKEGKPAILSSSPLGTSAATFSSCPKSFCESFFRTGACPLKRCKHAHDVTISNRLGVPPTSSSNVVPQGGGEGALPALQPLPLRACPVGGGMVYDRHVRRTVRQESLLYFIEWGGRLVFDAYNPRVFAEYCERAAAANATAATAAVIPAAAAVSATAGSTSTLLAEGAVVAEEVASRLAEVSLGTKRRGFSAKSSDPQGQAPQSLAAQGKASSSSPSSPPSDVKKGAVKEGSGVEAGGDIDPFRAGLQQKTERELMELVLKTAAATPSPSSSDDASSAGKGDEEGEEEMVNVVNPATGEMYGPRGKEPTRFGDWENKGRCTDF